MVEPEVELISVDATALDTLRRPTEITARLCFIDFLLSWIFKPCLLKLVASLPDKQGTVVEPKEPKTIRL